MTENTENQPLNESIRTILKYLPIIVKSFIKSRGSLILLIIQYRIREGPLQDHQEEIAVFEDRLRKDWGWGRPIDLFEISILTHLWMGRVINNDIREEQLEIEEDNYSYEALLRLHARGVQVARETSELIKRGYANGALSRWRSLHELSVTAKFIQENGEEVAERFIVYNDLKSYYDAKVYHSYQEDLGFDIVSSEELRDLEIRKDEIRKEYGNPIDDNGWGWGWAAEEFPENSATFSRIEESTGLDEYRPYYKLASNTIHGSSKGVLTSIDMSIPAKEGPYSTVFAGPTNTGFTDPAQLTLLSLQELTESLFELRPDKRHRLVIDILNESITPIGKAFSRRQQHIERTA